MMNYVDNVTLEDIKKSKTYSALNKTRSVFWMQILIWYTKDALT